jgi:hypothetical protein
MERQIGKPWESGSRVKCSRGYAASHESSRVKRAEKIIPHVWLHEMLQRSDARVTEFEFVIYE